MHDFSPPVDSPLSSFYTSRLCSQKSSIYQYVQFRNLSRLINSCEQMTTIDCLNYLHHNASDYLQRLSTVERQSFQNRYCTTKKMLFHTFWDNPQTLNDPLLLLHIQSHLYTQNRLCSNLIIWTLPLPSGEIDPKYNVHAPSLQFRSLRIFENELREVGVDVDPYGLSWVFGSLFGPTKAVVSDTVRFVILHKLGGMYIDADILLLRDFQPFYTHQFSYRWSTLNEFNTAVLGLSPTLNVSSSLIPRSSLRPVTLNRLPSFFFDPLWLVANNIDRQTSKLWRLTNNTQTTFESVFRSRSELSRQGRAVFDGAFAFYWHALHRTASFEQGSFLDQWKDFLHSQLLEGT